MFGLSAWTDPHNDALCGGFFSETLETLRTAHVRPRFNGWIPFFEEAGERITACLRGDVSDASLLIWLNTEFSATQARARVGTK